MNKDNPAREKNDEAQDRGNLYNLQQQLGIEPQQEKDYFPADPYYDKYEEINDLQALSELVPDILEDGVKIGWRMTLPNDECWKSDERLLAYRFATACPAKQKLIRRQMELQKGNNEGTTEGHNVLALRAAAMAENDLEDEIGKEVEYVEHESNVKNQNSVHTINSRRNCDEKGMEKEDDIGDTRIKVVEDKANDTGDDEDSDVDEGEGYINEDEDEVAQVTSAECDEKSEAISDQNKLELERCLTQDLQEEEKIPERDFNDSEKIMQPKNDRPILNRPAAGSDMIMNETTAMSRRDIGGDFEIEESEGQREESAAPPTIVMMMSLSLPMFKPATGCTNASDFVVRCFIARLRSGITVVKHGRSRWCKSRLRILHVHPDGKSLSWRPAAGEPTSSKRPPKLNLSSCIEVRHGWTSDSLCTQYTGTAILRSKCEASNAHKSFSLIFPKRTVDITAKTADQCKVLMEGFSALCFRLQVANLSTMKKNEEDEKQSIPTSTATGTSFSNVEK